MNSLIHTKSLGANMEWLVGGLLGAVITLSAIVFGLQIRVKRLEVSVGFLLVKMVADSSNIDGEEKVH